MIREHHLHVQKIGLGKEICTIFAKGEVLEQSLSTERQQALDLYRKSIPRLYISTIQLWSHRRSTRLINQQKDR